MRKRIVVSALLAIAFTTVAMAQMGGGKAKPSPAASATCDLGGGKSIKTDYSSPRMRGRKIYGDLVPFDKVWRTGANEATTFVPSSDVEVGGKNVPAGSYTIFTVPTADQWKLIINKKTGEWGIPYKYESDELARIPMSVSKTSGPVEDFKIDFEQGGSKCALHMEWEDTRATVEVSEK